MSYCPKCGHLMGHEIGCPIGNACPWCMSDWEIHSMPKRLWHQYRQWRWYHAGGGRWT